MEIKWVGAIDKVTRDEVEGDMRKLSAYSEDQAGVLCYLALIDESRRYKEELKVQEFGISICERRTIKPFSREIDALLFGYTPAALLNKLG